MNHASQPSARRLVLAVAAAACVLHPLPALAATTLVGEGSRVMTFSVFAALSTRTLSPDTMNDFKISLRRELSEVVV